MAYKQLNGTPKSKLMDVTPRTLVLTIYAYLFLVLFVY